MRCINKKYFSKKKIKMENTTKIKNGSIQIFSELQGETKFLNFVSEWISTTESKAKKLAKRQTSKQESKEASKKERERARKRARKKKRKKARKQARKRASKRASEKAWNGISLTPTFTLTCN